ncbi:unnamed protein product [Polarella glacialis]|uniref:Transmembrane protein 14C n=1 Tax=Polarella glacialis TaxID=89957 RepID=A0A813EIA2_POLGL|nr:unnamed protein product [Polarella glacialis]
MAPPPGAAHLNLTVGGLLAAGGAYGYWKKGSVGSLIGGGGCGALMAGSGIMVEKDPQTAFLIGSITSGLLTSAMLPPLLKSGKMPTAWVSVLGVAAFAYNGFQLWKWWDPETLPLGLSKKST